MAILPQLLINSLITGSLYALAAAGFALGFRVLGVLNFAHGHLMMVGAYAMLAAIAIPGLAPILQIALVIATMIVVTWILLDIVVLPLARYSPLLPFVSTLALAMALEATVAMSFGVNVRSLNISWWPGHSNTGGSQSIELLGGDFMAYITQTQIIIIFSALAILVGVALILGSTSIGRAVRALASAPLAAQSLGLARNKIIWGVVLVGNLITAYAGILVGLETNLQPTMGQAFMIKAFAAIILGGMGSVWGAVLGSYLLGFIENFAIGIDIGEYSLPAGYKDAFAYSVILIMLLVRPQGLLGRKMRSE